MPQRRQLLEDFDSPWKEALEHFFKAFLAFFFPQIHADLDWTKGYESLDKELRQVVREAATGRRLADKLFKVWRQNGEETWLLVHIEVQGEREVEFPRRMFVYNYRIFDRYNRPVVSLAVLTDDRADWRPAEFAYGDWGYRTQIRYGVTKLLDYASRKKELESEESPFAAVVLAHLAALETRNDPHARRLTKFALLKRLYDRGLNADDVRQLFWIIDWMITLPAELEEEFRQELARYEEERHMPYVSSIERLARDEGLKTGLLAGIAASLKAKFGAAGSKLMPRIRKVNDVDRLHAILDAIPDAKSITEVRQGLE